MKKNIQKHNRGSAIVVTMLFGTIAMAITLLLASFSINDYLQVSSVDDSNTAYYANNASTELLLGSYDYDRTMMLACSDMQGSSRISEDIYFDKAASTLKKSDGKSAYSCNSTLKNDSPKIISQTMAYYFVSGPVSLTFKPNESKEFTVPQGGSNNTQYIISGLTFINEQTSGQAELSLEVTFYNADGTQIQKAMYTENRNSQQSINNVSGAKYMRIRAYFHNLGNSNNASNIKDSTAASFKIENQGKYFDSGVTTIESITEFGLAKRKAETKIDRQNGTIINQGDFVLYGGNNITIR